MMKMIVTWKNQGTVDFEVKQEKVKAEFKTHGLRCVNVNEDITEFIGRGTSKDYSRFWITIWELNEHYYFYDVVKKCIWHNGKPLEDVIEECKEDIASGELIVHE